MVHEFKNESQWVFEGGIHSDEWHNVSAPETTTGQCLFVKPLPKGFQ